MKPQQLTFLGPMTRGELNKAVRDAKRAAFEKGDETADSAAIRTVLQAVASVLMRANYEAMGNRVYRMIDAAPEDEL